MNVDFWRRARGINPLSANDLLSHPLPADGAQPAEQAMVSRDKLRAWERTMSFRRYDRNAILQR
jgi:hypothetical protein